MHPDELGYALDSFLLANHFNLARFSQIVDELFGQDVSAAWFPILILAKEVVKVLSSTKLEKTRSHKITCVEQRTYCILNLSQIENLRLTSQIVPPPCIHRRGESRSREDDWRSLWSAHPMGRKLWGALGLALAWRAPSPSWRDLVCACWSISAHTWS